MEDIKHIIKYVMPSQLKYKYKPCGLPSTNKQQFEILIVRHSYVKLE